MLVNLHVGVQVGQNANSSTTCVDRKDYDNANFEHNFSKPKITEHNFERKNGVTKLWILFRNKSWVRIRNHTDFFEAHIDS